jgi:hypothetical protein
MSRTATDKYEAAVDQAIATCGGDLRGALKALIIANEFLESEMCDMAVQVAKSVGEGRRYAKAS